MAKGKKIKAAKRLDELPPYLFAQIDKLKDEVKSSGADVIDLGVGDPDKATPKEIVLAMSKAIRDKANHSYPAYQGSLDFRKSSAKYLKQRIKQSFDPDTEILSLIGSKEGIAHLPIAFVDKGDVTLVPNPGYPVYAVSTRFCGGEPVYMPLLKENNFLPDLDKIPVKTWNKAKILYLNYPNNPTGAVATESFFKHAIKLATKYGVLIAHDAAYFEIFSGKKRPLSILEIPGGRDCAIEFYSHSKTFSMTGWRIGFVAGASVGIEALSRVKNNIDSGAFTAIQQAAIAANELPAKVRGDIRKLYGTRRKNAARVLRQAGFDVFDSGATFYLWINVPSGFTSAEFSMRALKEAHVVVTPGNGFGESGEGYFRLALCEDDKLIAKAVKRLAKMIEA